MFLCPAIFEVKSTVTSRNERTTFDFLLVIEQIPSHHALLPTCPRNSVAKASDYLVNHRYKQAGFPVQ
jgi:hypothetical protein